MRDSYPYIKAIALTDFPELVASLGGDPLVLLDKAGLSPSVLANPESFISFRSMCKLYEITSVELKRPDFAMLLVQRHAPNFTNMGPVALLANFTATLRDWFEAALKYWALHTNGYTIKLLQTDTPGLVSVRYVADSFVLPGRQASEHALGCAVTLGRLGCGTPHENPVRIHFQHAAPEDATAQQAVFRCPIVWGTEHNEVIMEERVLALPTKGYLSMLRPLMDHYVSRRMHRVEGLNKSVTLKVSLVIPSIIGSGQCNAEMAAAAIGSNLRAMQRQLAEENTTFSEILDQVRQNLARHYLLETGLPIQRISELLEYSSTAAFTNSFTRWEHVSPLKFRQAHAPQKATPAALKA